MGMLDYIIIGIIAILIFFSLRRIKKKGGGCGGNCSGCSISDCHDRKDS